MSRPDARALLRVEPAASEEEIHAAASPGERYPQTRLRLLTELDVANFDFAQLDYAINEMYARRGAPFVNEPMVAAEYRKFGWYHPVPSHTEAQIEAALSPNVSSFLARRAKRK
jgi:hypothetical protein